MKKILISIVLTAIAVSIIDRVFYVKKLEREKIERIILDGKELLSDIENTKAIVGFDNKEGYALLQKKVEEWEKSQPLLIKDPSQKNRLDLLNKEIQEALKAEE